MKYQKFSVAFGASVWLMATLLVSFWGNQIFLLENKLLLTGLYLGSIPVLYLLATWVFSRYKLSGNQILESAVLMSVPGMAFDVICLKFHAYIFPTLTLPQAIVLGSWIIWAYVIILVIGLIRGKKMKPWKNVTT